MVKVASGYAPRETRKSLAARSPALSSATSRAACTILHSPSVGVFCAFQTGRPARIVRMMRSFSRGHHQFRHPLSPVVRIGTAPPPPVPETFPAPPLHSRATSSTARHIRSMKEITDRHRTLPQQRQQMYRHIAEKHVQQLADPPSNPPDRRDLADGNLPRLSRLLLPPARPEIATATALPFPAVSTSQSPSHFCAMTSGRKSAFNPVTCRWIAQHLRPQKGRAKGATPGRAYHSTPATIQPEEW